MGRHKAAGGFGGVDLIGDGDMLPAVIGKGDDIEMLVHVFRIALFVQDIPAPGQDPEKHPRGGLPQLVFDIQNPALAEGRIVIDDQAGVGKIGVGHFFPQGIDMAPGVAPGLQGRGIQVGAIGEIEQLPGHEFFSFRGIPNSVMAFLAVARPTSARERSFSSATFRAVRTTWAGSLRRPRRGCGVR